MAHPMHKAAKSSAEAKLKKLSGSHGTVKDPSGNKAAPGEYQNGPMKAVKLGAEGTPVQKNLGRYARGGSVKGKGSTVNVIIAQQPDNPAPAAAMPPKPIMPPPQPPMAAPPPPPMLPPGLPPGGPGAAPPGMPPMMRKAGGRVGKFTGGAGSGIGREEKTAHAKRRGK